ncbi:MAG: hypothetical protein Q9165_008511 [Trypethelium subeluteriae]
MADDSTQSVGEAFDPFEDPFIARRKYYLGSAKVRLRHLCFENEFGGGRTLDRRNIARLRRVFEVEGCHRDDPEHHVPVVIDPGLLNSARDEAKIADADPDILLDLREEYSNARAFCDGDIFRHLRHYQQAGDDARAGRWLARLSKSKFRDVKQLIDKVKPLCTAFDRLLPFRGLWASFRIGTLHRILTLSRILNQWKFIMGPIAPQLLDSQTVAFGQLLIPSISTKDRELIRKGPSGIFDQVDSSETRLQLFRRLEQAGWNNQGRILSLYTFTEDTKYIEPCAQIMRSIIPKLKRDDSILRLFRKNWDGKEHSTLPLQCSEDCTVDMKSDGLAWDVGYHQLWLFAMRYFPLMTRTNPRKDKGGEAPESDTCVVFWPMFAELATDLGFDTPEIQKLKNNDPTESILLNTLRSLRPLSQDVFFEASLKDEIRKLKEAVKSWPRTTTATIPPCSLKQDSKDISLMQRCGRPYHEAYIKDRPLLFLQNVYLNKRVEDRYATSFAFKRDIFRCFFEISEVSRQHVIVSVVQQASTNNASRRSNTTASREPQARQPQTAPSLSQHDGPPIAGAESRPQTSKRPRESQGMDSLGPMDARMVSSPDRGDLPHSVLCGPFCVPSEQKEIVDIRFALVGKSPERVIYLFRALNQLRNQQYSFVVVNQEATRLAYVENPLDEDAKLFFAEPKGQPTGREDHERQEQGSISDEVAREITCLMTFFYPQQEQNSNERQTKRRRNIINDILSHHPFNKQSL